MQPGPARSPIQPEHIAAIRLGALTYEGKYRIGRATQRTKWPGNFLLELVSVSDSHEPYRVVLRVLGNFCIPTKEVEPGPPVTFDPRLFLWVRFDRKGVMAYATGDGVRLPRHRQNIILATNIQVV